VNRFVVLCICISAIVDVYPMLIPKISFDITDAQTISKSNIIFEDI
jgi:hypothetical protein